MMDRNSTGTIVPLGVGKVPGCTLGSARGSGCNAEKCDRCGWNRDEQARRRTQIKENGLRPGGTYGLRCLTICRKEKRDNG